jgi:hypothetical protein
MIYLILLLSIIAFFEIKYMMKNHFIKEIVVFSGIAMVSILLGFLYFEDPNRSGFAEFILGIFKINIK